MVFCSASRKLTRLLRVQVLHDLEDLLDDLRREPIDGSSSRIIVGRAISARPIAVICCSPPEV
jgi:hypothetical protein